MTSRGPDSLRSARSRRGFLLTVGGGAMALGLGLRSRLEAAADASLANGSGPTGGLIEAMVTSHRTGQALGSQITMVALHRDLVVGERALDAAFAELARVERVMSIYLPGSEVSRLNSAGVLEDPDPYLVDILGHAAEMSARSGGAFDITVQPLWELYAAAQRVGGLPTATAIDETRERVDWRGVDYSPTEVRLRNPRMGITLNGIAQGFAADRAMEALKRHGIEHALVNAGEVSALGRKDGGIPWVVGVQHPRKADAYFGLVALDGRCMSTSGDYETSFSADLGSNHIFDPSTGRSPESLSSVTVVAPDAVTADALSTAIFTMGPERGLELAGTMPKTDVFLVTKDQQTLATRSFPWRREADSPGSSS